MRFSYYVLILVFVLSSCKSEFELIRTSNDPKKIYETALKYYDKGEYDKAQSLLELSIPNYRGKEEAEDLFYKYANTHYLLGEYILASHYFKSFANTFYNSDKKEEAEYLSAYSNYKLSPNSKLDQSYTQKAIDGFQKFINTYPRSERVEKCNMLIDEMRSKLEQKAFDQGKLYYNISQYQSAVKAFANMLAEFPESERAEEVRYLMLKASYQLAKKSIYEKKQERFEETIKLYERFMKKHPASKYASEVKKINKTTIKELKNLKA